MEVIVTYELNGETGKTAFVHADYETARDEAEALVPDGATRLNIRVNRED